MPNRWNLQQTERLTAKIVRAGLEKFGRIVKDEVEKGAPDGIKKDIRVIFGLQRIKIVTNHPAAAFVEFGTPPHRIEPTKSHGLLVFEVDGETVFVKGGVDHPGTQPNPFMREGVEKAMRRIRQAFR